MKDSTKAALVFCFTVFCLSFVAIVAIWKTETLWGLLALLPIMGLKITADDSDSKEEKEDD